MPITDISACPTTRDDTLLQWLCVEANRVDRYGRPHVFLNSVHNWFHRRGSITSAQRSSVRQIMEQEPRPAGTVVNDSDTADEVEAPTQRAYDRAATWEQAANIPSGTFQVWLQDDTDDEDDPILMTTLKIHTIVRSATTNLVGKRVVSRLTAANTWETFAFVTQRGRLKMWSRFEGRSSTLFARAAAGLLSLLASTEDQHTMVELSGEAFTDEDEGEFYEESWRVRVVERACRACNESLAGLLPEALRSGLHARCVNDGFSNARPIRRQVTADRPRPVRRSFHQTPAPPAEPTPATPTLSELGTGWLR